MGVTVYFNGNWYLFESERVLEEVLEESCDDAGYETELKNVIEYDWQMGE